MARVVLVGNSKGGVGKTSTASVIIEVWRAERGQYPVMVDCDSRNKLTKIFGDSVKRIDLAAPTDELIANPDLIISHWDALGDMILSGQDTVVDLGANVDRAVLEWASRSRIADFLMEIDLDVVVPTTADPLAIEGARAMLDAAAAIFPAARRVLVLNEAHGGFGPFDANPEFRALLSIPGVVVVRLPKCISAFWTDLERDGVSFATAIEIGAEKIGAVLGITRPWVAARALGDLARWGEAANDAFAPLYR